MYRAVTLVLILTIGCATAPKPRLDAEANAGPVPLAAGAPAPADGVWMSVAVAAQKAENCKLWEETGTRCIEELKKQPPVVTGGTVAKVIGIAVGALAVGFGTGYLMGFVNGVDRE